MSCRADLNKAILDKAFSELTEGRYTFNRIAEDTIQITNTGKAKSKEQAHAIAQSLIDRASKSFKGNIRGEINQISVYDPITIRFRVNPRYIDYEYGKLDPKDQTDTKQEFHSASEEEEQDMVNSNTGPNSFEQLGSNPIEDTITIGYLPKFLQLKKDLLKSARQKLNDINKKINSTQTSSDERVKANIEKRRLREEIEGIHVGNKNRDKEGLEDEILRIENNSTTLAIGAYVMKDLDRIDRLVDSSSVADLEDAKALVDFYEQAGIFRSDVANPFFLTDEIFQTDNNGKSTGEFLLSKEIRDKFKEWADQATSYKEQLANKIKEVTVAQVNSDPSVKNTYGDKEFTHGEVTNELTGLGDTDWFSMWSMDPTQGIFSKNGILPQVMFSTLQGSIADDVRGAREVAEETDRLNPDVIKRLKELNQELKKLGILGSNAVTYQIFKEKTKDGHETGNFVTKFTPEFVNEEAKAKNVFWSSYNKAKVAPVDRETKNVLIKDTYRKLRDWRRKNTTIMDVGAIPEIIGDEEFKEFTGQFNSLKSDGHRKELVALLGEKEYSKQVEKQKKLLREYADDRQSYIDTLMDTEDVLETKDLSNNAWYQLENWDKQNSPFYGVTDFSKVIFDNHIDNYGKYNTFIPRRNTVELGKDEKGYNYTFKDTNTPTGYYNDTYEKYIENDSVLGKFHDLLVASNQFVRECLPYDKQLSFSTNSLPAMFKNSTELLADGTNTTNILRNLFESIRHIWEQIRLSFGVVEQSQNDYSEENAITGESERRVNDSFIANNQRAISERMTIEAARFLQAYNGGLKGGKLDKITRYTNLQLSKMDADSLLILAEYLGVPLTVQQARSKDVASIKKITGDSVEIGRIIRDFSTHTVVQAYSFDLAKLIKHGTYAAAMYSARVKAKPVIDIMKNDYESIKNPKLNNVSKQLFNIPGNKNATKGERDNAKKQIEDWYERVVLDDYGLRHTGIFGSTKEGALIGRKIYSTEDREKYNQLTDLISKETDDKTKTNLLNIRNNLGKTRTTTAAFNNLLAWIRTMRLGFNLSSGVTNYIEGWMSNMIIAATGEYFDPNMIYRGYATTYSSFWKNISYGKWEPGTSKKQRALMDKFKVVMNTANQLQESTEKTFSDKLEWIHPHAINERVEYNNQGALFNAMLRSSRDQDHTIKDKDGNISSLWDAYDNNGNLKDEFRTEENIKNWEDLQGDDYKTFEQKLSKALVLAHGNYDEMRGMMAKSTVLGKAGLMFKTWLPQQLYWRFAIEQDDLQSGNRGFKGKYRSYGAGSAALHGAAVGAFTFGPIGAAVGAIAGLALGKTYGTDSGVGLLRETMTSTLVLIKKMVGMPINTIAGRKLIDSSGKQFDNWIKEGKFTRQDANALKSNMADIANQLMLLGLMLMVKSLFWDDKGKSDSTERKAHNLLVNRIMQLASQAGMYVNPSDIYKSTIGSNGVIQYMTDLGKEIDAIDEALQGRDTVQSGVNAGKSHLWSQTKKTLVPGIFKSIESGGFGTQMQSQQQQSPFDYYFKSDEAKEKIEIKRERAERKLDLENKFTKQEYPDDDERKKVIKEELDEEIPTQAKLKKLGLTKKEYEDEYKKGK